MHNFLIFSFLHFFSGKIFLISKVTFQLFNITLSSLFFHPLFYGSNIKLNHLINHKHDKAYNGLLLNASSATSFIKNDQTRHTHTHRIDFE